MKTTFKALVLAASLSMIAGSAFAGTDLSSISDLAATDIAARNTAIVDLFTINGAYVSDASDNVAIITQMGETGNFAMIDQSDKMGNVAVIMQDSTTNVNSAYIAQTGSLNTAIINQR